GRGLMTKYLPNSEKLIATDLDPDYVALLGRQFGDRANVEVRPLDLAGLCEDGIPKASLDTVLCSNVLEHIADDRAALLAIHDVLAPGGHVVLIVPALKALYGSID